MQNSVIFEGITKEELRAELRLILTEILESKLKPTPPKEYITVKETSQKLKISLPTTKRLLKTGELPSYRIGGRILLRADEVELAVKRIETRKYKR